MAKKQKFDSFEPFAPTQVGAEITLENQVSIETLEDGKYMPDKLKKEPQTKKRGRPKLNRETKKRISFTILPSLYEKASKLAYKEGKSVSELIADFLTEYVNKHSK